MREAESRHAQAAQHAERERERERERETTTNTYISFVRCAHAAAAKNATLRLEKMDWASGRAAPRRGKEI